MTKNNDQNTISTITILKSIENNETLFYIITDFLNMMGDFS
jgi:hypothetical protein